MRIEKRSESLEIEKSKEVPDKWSVEVWVIPHEDLVYEMQFIRFLGGEDKFVQEITASSVEELNKKVEEFIREIKEQYHSFIMKQVFSRA